MDIKAIGVEEWLNVWEKSATWDIAQSTISSLTMGELRALDEQDGATFYERLDREKMNYGWIEGSPEFKAEVAKLYRREVNPDHILQTNGCTGANLNAIMAVVEPGDHVIAEWPTYAPLYEIPRTLGAEVEYWELREELGWKPDIEELKRSVRPNTKLICINNASNPIGTVLDVDMLGQIAEIARSVGAHVLCDEVYLPLENTEDLLSMADVYGKAIVTNSVSKTYSTPAARVGWVVADEEVSNRIRTYRDYTMICGGVFNDALATYVLKHKDKILERNRKIVFGNRDIAQAWIDTQHRVSWTAPQGVSTSFIQLDIPEDDEEFCKRLLAERGVLLDWQHLFGRFREGQPRLPELDRRHVAQRRVDPEVVVPVHVVRELGPELARRAERLAVDELGLQYPVGRLVDGVVVGAALGRQRPLNAEGLEHQVDLGVVELAAAVRVEDLDVRDGEGERRERRLDQPGVLPGPGGVADDLPVVEVDEQADVVPRGPDAHVGQVAAYMGARRPAAEAARDDVGHVGLVDRPGVHLEPLPAVCADQAVLPHDAADPAPADGDARPLERRLYLARAVPALAGGVGRDHGRRGGVRRGGPVGPRAHGVVRRPRDAEEPALR